jgi:hypothetical protein
MKLRVWIRSLQIFNAIPLRFSRLLRNSPRPWVKHAHSPSSPGSLEKTHQKAKSSMSLNPYPQLHQTPYQESPLFFSKKAVKRIRSTCLDYSQVEVAADTRRSG